MMNLIELFETLSVPEFGSKVYNAVPIPDYPFFRVAVNFEGLPVLILKVRTPAVSKPSIQNFRLRYLQIEQNLSCKIRDTYKETNGIFTVITFTSFEKGLQEYFFKISEPLLMILGKRLLQEEIATTIYKFVEIFSSLGDNPTKTIHGLWTELFLIEVSSKSKILLSWWHNFPEEKYDFNSGQERIEVKSNSTLERIHVFSSEQLNPPFGTKLLIASIFIRQSTSGISIEELIERITCKISNEVSLIEKMNRIISKTLGNSLEESLKIKYDYTLAKESLAFYDYKSISKIEEINIPNEVFEVRYKSDLSYISPINIKNLKNKGELFKGL